MYSSPEELIAAQNVDDEDFIDNSNESNISIKNLICSDDKEEVNCNIKSFNHPLPSNSKTFVVAASCNKNGASFNQLKSIKKEVDGLDYSLIFNNECNTKLKESRDTTIGSLNSFNSRNPVIILPDSEDNLQSTHFSKQWFKYDNSSVHFLKLDCEDCSNDIQNANESISKANQTGDFRRSRLMSINGFENEDLNMFCESVDQKFNGSAPFITCHSDSISTAQIQLHERQTVKGLQTSSQPVENKPSYIVDKAQSFDQNIPSFLSSNNANSHIDLNLIPSIQNTVLSQILSHPLSQVVATSRENKSSNLNIMQSLVKKPLSQLTSKSDQPQHCNLSSANDSYLKQNNINNSNPTCLKSTQAVQDLTSKPTTILNIPNFHSTWSQPSKLHKSSINDSSSKRFSSNSSQSITSSIPSHSLTSQSSSYIELNQPYKSKLLSKSSKSSQNSNKAINIKDASDSTCLVEDNILYNSLAKLRGFSNQKPDPQTLLGMKPLPFKWPSSLDQLVASLKKLGNLHSKLYLM